MVSPRQACKGHWEPLCSGLIQEEKAHLPTHPSFLSQAWLLNPLLFLVVHPSTLLSPDSTTQLVWYLLVWLDTGSGFPLRSQALIWNCDTKRNGPMTYVSHQECFPHPQCSLMPLPNSSPQPQKEPLIWFCTRGRSIVRGRYWDNWWNWNIDLGEKYQCYVSWSCLLWL